MPNTLKGIEYLGEHLEARAKDLKEAFLDDSIAGIVCAIGGDDTYRLLPYLMEDAQFIDAVEKHPKLFTGFSDTTVNHLMFYKLGLSTFYGPNFICDLGEISNAMLPYSKRAFESYLEGNEFREIISSEIWYEEREDFSKDAIGTNRIPHKEERGFELLQGKDVFRGELLGGCLESLRKYFADLSQMDMESDSFRYPFHIVWEPADWECEGRFVIKKIFDEQTHIDFVKFDFVKFIVNEQDTKQIFLSLSELMILRYVADKKQIKIDKAQELTQVSEDEVRKSLANLIKYGLLETSGKDYMLTARVYEAVKSDIEYTRDKTIQYIRAKEMIIEYIKKHGSANKSTVQELCGFSEQQARRTLEKMQKEYIIKLANGGRYAKYTLI